MSKKISDDDAKLLSKDEISLILLNMSVATGSQRIEFADAYDYLKEKHGSLVELNDSAKQKFGQVTRISKNPIFDLADLFEILIFFLVLSVFAAIFIEFAYDYHKKT